MERNVAILLSLVTFVVIGLIGWLVFSLIDSLEIAPTRTTNAFVEAKEVIPARTTSIIIGGRVILPNPHPESYQLHFTIEGEDVDYPVEKALFDEIKVGDRIDVDYGYGRLSNACMPKNVRSAGNSVQGPAPRASEGP